jgi:hypothetical protein
MLYLPCRPRLSFSAAVVQQTVKLWGLMWEEHPEYQKAQTKAVGLLVAVGFLGAIIYSASHRDWDLLRIVLCGGIGLAVAIAIFPLVAWMVVKVGARRQIRSTRPRPSDEA